MNGRIPKIKSIIPLYCEPADESLPVYPNGNVVYHTDCTCEGPNLRNTRRVVGRTMIDGVWVKVCMTCGSLRYGSGT